jgi:hypothetical protein
MTFYGWSGPAWTGAPAFGDSSQVVAPGVAVTMTRNVPNAVYNCVVVAVDSLGNRSCSSSVVSKLARSKFAKVGDLH